MKKKSLLISVLTVLFAAIVWILIFDISYFWEECADCLYTSDIIRYRIFTIPVYTKKFEHHSPRGKIAKDLNVPCLHENLKRTHYVRRWGGVVCKWPCENMPYIMKHSLSYDPSILHEFVDKDPNLPEIYYQKVIIEHDREYLDKFVGKLIKENEKRKKYGDN